MSRVAVVGAGAMGSVYAGLMASAGHEVHAVTLWEDHVEAINRDGLRVEGVSGDRVAAVHASVDSAGIGECDLVIIATKAMDVAAGARQAGPLIGANTVVQTSQNGLGSADAVREVLGPRQLAVGVVGGFGASVRAPGHVHHNGMEMVRLGARPDGPPREALERAAAIWESAGFTVGLFDDVDRMVWEKLIMNVTFSATCCLTGMTIGEVLDDETAWGLSSRCLAEAVEVAAALEVDLRVGDPVEHVRALAGRIRGARPSMLLDHLAGRRSEIGAINGAIPREGARVGVATPVNRTLVEVVVLRERDFAAQPTAAAA
ncbi:ketopantoate reductase family protein [Pseudonocardia sp. DLS-67]